MTKKEMVRQFVQKQFNNNLTFVTTDEVRLNVPSVAKWKDYQIKKCVLQAGGWPSGKVILSVKNEAQKTREKWHYKRR